MLAQQFKAHFQICAVRRGQFKIKVQPAEIAKSGHLKSGAIGFQMSSTTTNTQVQKSSKSVIIRLSSVWKDRVAATQFLPYWRIFRQSA
jgi:hypothetical protein